MSRNIRLCLSAFALVCTLLFASSLYAQEDVQMPKDAWIVHPKGQQLRPLMMNGNPIFVIGAYGIPKDCSISELKAAGWNAVLTNMHDPNLKTILEECGKEGIGVIPNLTDVVYGLTGNTRLLVNRKEAVRKFIKEYKHYPALWGYYLADEPENFLMGGYEAALKTEPDLSQEDFILDALGWVKPTVKNEDPDRYTFMCIAWYSTYMKLQNLCDVNMPNEYPTNNTKKEFEGDNAEILCDARQAAGAAEAYGGLGFIYTPYGLDNNQGIETYRTPTINEFRYSVYAPITAGAMGTMFWAGYRCSKPYAESVIFPVTCELNDLTPFFIGKWMNEKVKWQPTERTTSELKEYDLPAVNACLRRAEDGRYLLLTVNNTNAPVEAKFDIDLKGLPRTCRDFITKETQPIKRGSISTTLSPYCVRAYIFSVKD